MSARYCLIVLLVLSGCATQHRPDYQETTVLVPDCANRDAQIRYYAKLKRFPVVNSDDVALYNRTIDIQIERLTWYCQ